MNSPNSNAMKQGAEQSRRFQFYTLDVFTDQRFGGNQLAVFPHAQGLSDREMQSLASEFNLSETTFVFPPDDQSNTARVRIFNRTYEMDFAGHPNVGTACLLARLGNPDDELRFEQPAGTVVAAIERDEKNEVTGATIAAPQPLSVRGTVPAETVAECLGIAPAEILTARHQPTIASVGVFYVLAEVTLGALKRAVPDLQAFRKAAAQGFPEKGQFPVYIYAVDGEEIQARMYAPIAGTWEDPATGSAASDLAALLLSLSDEESASYRISQGKELGRPSVLQARARRRLGDFVAEVGGPCVPVLQGEIFL